MRLLAALLISALRLSAGETVVTGLDARLELGEIAYWLAAQPDSAKAVTPEAESYLKDIRDHFKTSRRHPAIYATPLGYDSGLRSHVLLGGSLPEISTKTARTWIRALAAFSEASRFEAFFEEHKHAWDGRIRVFRDRMARERFPEKFETYTGMPFPRDIRIIFSPLLEATSSELGDTVHTERTLYSIFSTMLLENLGAAGIPEDVPVTLWHEIGHVALDGLLERSPRAELKDDYVRDLVTQAVTIRLFVRDKGEDQEQRHLGFEDPPERKYLVPLLRELRDFEKNREKYPTLKDFYPRLLSAL